MGLFSFRESEWDFESSAPRAFSACERFEFPKPVNRALGVSGQGYWYAPELAARLTCSWRTIIRESAVMFMRNA